MATSNLNQFCKSLPKVELHAHLNGSISDKTMYKLLNRRERGSQDFLESCQTTIAKGEKRTMEECFQMFKMIHEVVDCEDAVSIVANDVVQDFSMDGVVYLELRTTPRANRETGMTKKSYVDAVIQGIDTAIRSLSKTIYVRLLLSIDRRQNAAEATDTVLLAETYRGVSLSGDRFRVTGVDFSGDPRAGDVNNLLPVLQAAKGKGFPLAVHLSEIPLRNEETILLIKGATPDRIGHGTFMHPEVGGTDEIVQEVLHRKIPIEICLSSNLKTHTVPSVDKHHFKFWRQRGHPVIICTDDKGVFCTSLSEEYYLASLSFGLTETELQDLSLGAVDHIFEDTATKGKLKKLWEIASHDITHKSTQQ